jgi:hypothetical protein
MNNYKFQLIQPIQTYKSYETSSEKKAAKYFFNELLSLKIIGLDSFVIENIDKNIWYQYKINNNEYIKQIQQNNQNQQNNNNNNNQNQQNNYQNQQNNYQNQQNQQCQQQQPQCQQQCQIQQCCQNQQCSNSENTKSINLILSNLSRRIITIEKTLKL